MRFTTWVLVCAVVGVAAPALAQTPAEGTSPTVFRAGEAAEQPTVPVFRGSAVVMAPRAPEPARPVPAWRMGAGEKLWFVDPATGRVIACRERGTATVGRRAIECTERRLRALDG